mgnify:CR=1 FL=1
MRSVTTNTPSTTPHAASRFTSRFTGRFATRLGSAAVLAAGLLLGACTAMKTVTSEVSTYGDWPAARGAGSYTIERLPSQQGAGQQQDEIEQAAHQALQAAGFKPAVDGASPDVVVQIGARITRYDRAPWDDPLWWHPYGMRWVGPAWPGPASPTCRKGRAGRAGVQAPVPAAERVAHGEHAVPVVRLTNPTIRPCASVSRPGSCTPSARNRPDPKHAGGGDNRLKPRHLLGQLGS